MQNSYARAESTLAVQPDRPTPDATDQARSPDSLPEQPARRAEIDGADPSSDLARPSGDLEAVSKALGHSSVGTTQVYLSVIDQTAADDLVTVSHQRAEGDVLAEPNSSTAEIDQTAAEAAKYAGRRGAYR